MSSDEAVVEGLGRTGPLVTSAALILFFAFSALGAGPHIPIEIFATGMAVGILLDATVIRPLIVPTAVSLLGERAWWTPGRRSPERRVTGDWPRQEAEGRFTSVEFRKRPGDGYQPPPIWPVSTSRRPAPPISKSSPVMNPGGGWSTKRVDRSPRSGARSPRPSRTATPRLRWCGHFGSGDARSSSDTRDPTDPLSAEGHHI